jgi:hypothetical protein
MPMPTTGSSSSQLGRAIPLVNCLQCLVPAIKKLSEKDNWYYKCPRSCGKWWFEDFEICEELDARSLREGGGELGNLKP